MISKKNLLILTVVLVLFNVLPGMGQLPPGEYLNDPGAEEAALIDSMLIWGASSPRRDLHIDYHQLGPIVWMGGANGCMRYLKNDSTKLLSELYNCYENGWTKHVAQFDTVTKTKDYPDTITVSYNVSGDDLWTESISVNVVSNNLITVNSPVDVTAQLYQAFTFEPATMATITVPKAEFSVLGNGNNQTFPVNLENNIIYFLVFINDDMAVVNIKKIGV